MLEKHHLFLAILIQDNRIVNFIQIWSRITLLATMMIKAKEFCIPIASFWAQIDTFRGTSIASFVLYNCIRRFCKSLVNVLGDNFSLGWLVMERKWGTSQSSAFLQL